MNVALINPPQKTGYPQPPMGLALLAAVLEQHGHGVALVDLNIQPLPEFVSEADAVGITAVTPNIYQAWQVAREVRAMNPKARIIMGGPHPSLLPEETLRCAPVDAVVVGEGEKAILEAMHVETRGVIRSQPLSQPEIDELPFMAYHLLSWGRYRYMAPHGRYRPTFPMITSRGCPYSCGFCSKPVFGKTYRAQSPLRVFRELQAIVGAYGAREIAFYDDVFTLDRPRTFELCERIAPLKIHWTCETRVNLVTPDLLRQMKVAGCMAIAYGIESGSPNVRERLNKGIAQWQVEDAVEWTHKAGIETIGYFMIGSPGETAEDLRDTIEFAKDLELDYAQFSQTTAYPGTALYESLPVKPTSWDALTYTGGGNAVTRSFYFRPAYLWQRIKGMRSMADLALNLRGVGLILKGGI